MSADLKAAFPDMKGWSRSSLMYMRQFAAAWKRNEIVQAPLGQLPWYHHLALLERLKSRGDRIAYAVLAIENGWSRDVMVHQIELGYADQHGTSITNFKKLMPQPIPTWRSRSPLALAYREVGECVSISRGLLKVGEPG